MPVSFNAAQLIGNALAHSVFSERSKHRLHIVRIGCSYYTTKKFSMEYIFYKKTKKIQQKCIYLYCFCISFQKNVFFKISRQGILKKYNVPRGTLRVLHSHYFHFHLFHVEHFSWSSDKNRSNVPRGTLLRSVC